MVDIVLTLDKKRVPEARAELTTLVGDKGKKTPQEARARKRQSGEDFPVNMSEIWDGDTLTGYYYKSAEFEDRGRTKKNATTKDLANFPARSPFRVCHPPSCPSWRSNKPLLSNARHVWFLPDMPERVTEAAKEYYPDTGSSDTDSSSDEDEAEDEQLREFTMGILDIFPCMRTLRLTRYHECRGP